MHHHLHHHIHHATGLGPNGGAILALAIIFIVTAVWVTRNQGK